MNAGITTTPSLVLACVFYANDTSVGIVSVCPHSGFVRTSSGMDGRSSTLSVICTRRSIGATCDRLMHGRINIKTMRYPYKLTHSLNVSGNFKIGSRWNMNYSTGYDFTTKELSMTTLNITRDLHCWQMSASFVPIGPYKSYTFNIAVSSSLLKDLKWRQSSNYRDGQTWY